MSDNLKITCPSCGDTFPATDALDDYAKSKQEEFQAETEKQLKHKFENENKEKLKQLQLKIQEAEKEKGQYQIKLKNELKQKQKEIDQQNEKVLKIKEQEIQNKLKEKNSIEIEKLQEALRKKDKENEIQNQRQLKRIEEMEKQIKQSNVEIQGEVQEQLIEDYLRSKFPYDDVTEIKKGARGADCILTINYKEQKNLAQIYFESKDHKTFKEEWVDKLLSDMQERDIDYGILISTAIPKDLDKFSGFAERHGKRIMIIPMDYKIIHTLISMLRTNLISAFLNKKEFDAPKELKRLWDHISGPTFQLPLRNLYKTMKNMNVLIEKEKKFYETNITNKQKAMLDMEDEFKDLIKSFTLKVGSILPENLLEIENEQLQK